MVFSFGSFLFCGGNNFNQSFRPRRCFGEPPHPRFPSSVAPASDAGIALPLRSCARSVRDRG